MDRCQFLKAAAITPATPFLEKLPVLPVLPALPEAATLGREFGPYAWSGAMYFTKDASYIYDGIRWHLFQAYR